MKKVVIAGSAKLQDKITYWLEHFNNKEFKVLDYPKEIDEKRFIELYPNIHTEFLENITKTDILFIMNEDKNNKVGYIGYETYAELLFGLSQKIIYKKDIKLIILKMPNVDVGCYEEIKLWLKLGWIDIYKEEI